MVFFLSATLAVIAGIFLMVLGVASFFILPKMMALLGRAAIAIPLGLIGVGGVIAFGIPAITLILQTPEGIVAFWGLVAVIIVAVFLWGGDNNKGKRGKKK